MINHDELAKYIAGKMELPGTLDTRDLVWKAAGKPLHMPFSDEFIQNLHAGICYMVQNAYINLIEEEI